MKEKQKLLEMEKSEKYVFHGSPSVVEKLEPQQAYNLIEGQKVLDGEPAIFASSYVDYAIFMALLNRTNCPKGLNSEVGYHNGEPVFRATKKTLEQLGDKTKGYVYVFNRVNFTKINESEWVSYKTIEPVFVMTVTYSDFIPTIKEFQLDKPNIQSK